MEDDSIYWQIMTRQMPIVDKKDQEKFKNARIAVIGCGGIGGQTIEMLARMGVGELVLVDEDSFDWTNLNRQSLSQTDNIGVSKSETAKKKVEKIKESVEFVHSFKCIIECRHVGLATLMLNDE